MWNLFWIFSDQDKRWRELDRRLSASFGKMKVERRLVFSWLNYLRRQDAAHQKTHQEVEYTLGKQDAEITRLHKELRELRAEVRQAHFSPNHHPVRTKSGPESEPKSEPISGPFSRGGLVGKVVNLIRPQRREYVMQKVLELAEKGQYTTKQIETIIVREKGLCGRTAFYDYLKELRYKQQVRIGQYNGRKVLKLSEI